MSKKNRPAEKPPEKEKKKIQAKAAITWTLVASGAGAIVIGLAIFGAWGYGRLYEHRIFPGVRILDLRLDGLTENEARIALNEAIDQGLKDGLRFTYQGRDITVNAATIPQTGPDDAKDLIQYEIENPIADSMKFGRSGNLLRDSLLRWSARVKPMNIPVPITINESGVREAITHATEDIAVPPKEAELVITWNAQTNTANITAMDATEGRVIQFDPALAKLKSQAERLRFSPIALTDTNMAPTITKKDIEPLMGQAKAWAESDLVLTHEKTEYPIGHEMLSSWITAMTVSGSVSLTIDQNTFHSDIRTLTGLEQEGKRGTFTIEDGKITSFQAGTTGYLIDDEASIQNIVRDLGSASTIPLVVTQEDASLTGEGPEQFGIKEIIGIGQSNFGGSPTNRRKNIAIGVDRVDGTLIAPGEEFSMLKTLGPITAENGWLPELVIKGSKTTPELGGGLCQIGTTAFRAALNSGMKITERRNHSYRVSYYEPAGTDATIYEPAPDFKFLNDTSHHIYIHAYITGNEITYEFWGTKDGRQVTVAAPRIYNIVGAPPKKLVETTDLKPGQTKCTESAHAGADASLDYKVVYADGTVHEETFNSHYRPWGAVCLVGVEKLSEPETPAPTDGAPPAEEGAPITAN
jgi:vancomycin resistance protein YoaR